MYYIVPGYEAANFVKTTHSISHLFIRVSTLILRNFYHKMKQFLFDYSLKNIPIPSKDAYLRNLIEKAESVTRRMRWKTHFFLNADKSSAISNPFGLPSYNSPPTISDLKTFRRRFYQSNWKSKIPEYKRHISTHLGSRSKKYQFISKHLHFRRQN